MRALVEGGLKALGLPFAPIDADRLLRFTEEIERWNPRHRLVAATGRELMIRHVLDCLAGVPVIRRRPHRLLADLGSGAGFPGVPLAIFFPQSSVTLVERSARRADFLRNAAVILKLSNVRVIQADFREIRERFDVVTFRALTPLARRIRAISRLAAPGGVIAAYKGKEERIRTETEELQTLFRRIDVIRLIVPFLEEERHLVLLYPGD